MHITNFEHGLGYLYHASLNEFQAIESSLRIQSNDEGYIVVDRGADTSLQYLQVYFNGQTLDTDNMIILESLNELQAP